jgi:tetratricopeptide (TPR) repeat protein
LFYLRCSHRRLRHLADVLSLAVAPLSILGQTSNCKAAHPEYKTAEARAALDEGVGAFKGAQYEKAIADFQNAANLDPSLPNAKLYLGTALAQNVVPGLESPENLAIAQRAIDVLRDVLAEDPHDVNSMKQLASVYFNIRKLEDAKEWQKQVLGEDPDDPEAAYTVGVIDWLLAHQNVLARLNPIGLNDDGEGNVKAPAQVLNNIRSENSALVQEAIEYLNRAIEKRPGYDNAMAYLNLVYRRKADLDWENPAAREDDVAKANEWSKKAMDARKANEIRIHSQDSDKQ